MKIKHSITLLCVFVIIISSVGTFASTQTQQNKKKNKGIGVITQKDGFFTAELGVGKNEEPIYILKGSYQEKDKIILCDGTVICKDEKGKFNGIFKGEYFELKIIFEETSFFITGKYKFDKNKDDFKGRWIKDGQDGIIEKNKCFEFLYPITYIMPDDSTITVENKDDWYKIKDWYASNPDAKEKPKLQYPVDIKFADGNIKTINNEKEMKRAYDYCQNTKNDEVGWIKGTFQGMSEDEEIVIYQKDGIFTCELGIKGNERSFLNLEGNFHRRNRIIMVQGREDNRFSGAFIGANFIIITQLRGETRAQILYGLTRFDENYNSFNGIIWSSGSLGSVNRISGSFK